MHTSSESDRPLGELDLSVRTFNCLKRAGITSVDQLINTPSRALQKIGGIGGIYWRGFVNELAVNGITIPSDEGMQ